MSQTTSEVGTLAAYLRDDLQRIANTANDELTIIRRAGMADSARQAEEARVIDEARARAVRRVESTLRHLHAVKAERASGNSGSLRAEPVESDLDAAQVIPAVTDAEHDLQPISGRDEPEAIRHPRPADYDQVPDLEETQVIPASIEPERGAGTPTEPPSDPGRRLAAGGRHHATETAAANEEPETAGHPPPTDDNVAVTPPTPPEKPATATGSDTARLNRFLEFVVRQEPRLNWAVGEVADGTSVLVTDLAHGWIPAGIALPAGVRLLTPGRRSGKAPALIGDAVRIVTYAPGDSLRRSADFASTRTSPEPRKLPAIEGLERVLSDITHLRPGLPRLVHRLASAAATGAFVVDQEVDVLRVHLDTARYQLLVQYPDVNPALLHNCLLMAATESVVSGDPVSANYHLAWYQELVASA